MLVDLGFEDAQELSVKATLAVRVNKLIDAQSLSQAAAAKILGVQPPQISAIRNYKLKDISLEVLVRSVSVLGKSG